jgi:hypothetical protein
MSKRKTEMLSIAEAVALIDDPKMAKSKDPERWLIRRLRQRERELKMRILVSDTSGKGARYRVDRTALSWAMEMDGPHDRVAKALGDRLKAIENMNSRIDGRLEDLACDIAALAETYRGLVEKWHRRSA